MIKYVSRLRDALPAETTVSPGVAARRAAAASLRGHSSFGRAPPCQGGGSEFESRCPLHRRNKLLSLRFRLAAKTAPNGLIPPLRTELQFRSGLRGSANLALTAPFPPGGENCAERAYSSSSERNYSSARAYRGVRIKLLSLRFRLAAKTAPNGLIPPLPNGTTVPFGPTGGLFC